MKSEERQADYDEMHHQNYLDHVKTLTEIESQQIKSFDKSVLSVASGALGLSLLFSERLAPSVPVLSWLLYAAWGLLCLSILSTMLSFLLAAEASSKQREIFGKFYSEGFSGREAPNPFTPWIGRLNWLSLILTCLGVVCLTLFAISNFAERSKVADDQVQTSTAAANAQDTAFRRSKARRRAKAALSSHQAETAGSEATEQGLVPHVQAAAPHNRV